MFDDKKLDSLSAPKPGTKQPAADAAPSEIPATRWRDWFTGVAQVYNAWSESDRKYKEESSAKKAAVTDFGTDQPVRGEDGEIKQQLAAGSVQRDGTRGVFSWLQGLFTFHRDGEETYRTEGPKNRRTTEWFKDEKGLGVDGMSSTLSGGKKIEIVDMRATGEAIQKQLEAEIESQRSLLDRLEAQKAKTPASKTIDAQIQATQARIASAQTAIVTIKSDPTNRIKLQNICKQLGIYVEPTMKIVSEDSVTATEKVTRDGWKVIASETTTVKQTAQDGTINAKTGSTSQSLDLAEGKATKVDVQSSTAQKTDGTSTTASKSTSQTVSVGGGEVSYAGSTTNANTVTNKKGEAESGTSSTLGGNVSVVGGDNGVGVKGGVSASNATTKDGKTTTNEIAAHAAVTDNGLFRDASFAHRVAGKKMEGEIKVSHDGAITMVVTPPTDDDPSWHVVTTIRAGLRLDPSLGTKKPEGEPAQEGGTKASGSLGASVGATMTYSHAMSEEQMEAYMGAAEQAEASRAANGGGSYPEFGVLQKLDLLVHGDPSANPLAVMGSSAAAADIKPGDSVSLVLTAGAQAKLGGEQGGKDKGGAGIDVSGSVTYTRTLSVARDKDETVLVTVGFVEANKLDGSVSGNFEGATAKVGGSHEASDGESYTFRLDPTQPDYQSCYGAITSKLTRESVKALYADPMMKSHDEKRTLSDQGKDGNTVEMGVNVGPVNPRLVIGHEQQGSKDIAVARDGATGTISGGDSISASPCGIGGAKETDSAAASVDANGRMTLDVQSANQSSPSPTDWFRNLGTQVKSWFVKEDKPVTTHDLLAGGLAKTPGERVKELLDKQYAQLDGYKLAPADVDKLFSRAIDSNKWMSAATDPRVLEAWRRLRSDLLQPDIDMSLVPDPNDALQVQKATKLAQAQAVADFMKHWGTDGGYDAFVHVLREYGATMQRESTADDLGTRYEWPDSLSKYRVIYEAAAAKADLIPQLFGELSGKPDGAQKWHAMTDKQLTALDTVHAAIATNKDIRSERARAEMLDACSTKKAQFIAAAKYFDRAASPQDPTAAPRTESSEAEVGATLFAQARIPALLADLSGFKLKERQLFQQGEAALATWISQKDALPVMSQLRELYEFWVAKVKELRKLYTIAKVPQDQWKVSTGPNDRRHVASTEPYAEAMIKIYKQAGGDDYNGKAFAADWEERWTHY